MRCAKPRQATAKGCGRSRVIIVENSLSLLGDGYQRAAVVFDPDPDAGTLPRWVCQERETRAAFLGRVRGELERDWRGGEEIVVHTLTGFWDNRGSQF